LRREGNFTFFQERLFSFPVVKINKMIFPDYSHHHRRSGLAPQIDSENGFPGLFPIKFCEMTRILIIDLGSQHIKDLNPEKEEVLRTGVKKTIIFLSISESCK